MAEDPRTSSGSDGSSARKKAPNFSRPQPQPQPSALKSGQKNYRDRHVHIIDAFHEPNREPPTERRVSGESERTDNTSSERSAGSDFAWDGHSGELDSQSRKMRYDAQRCSAKAPLARPSSSTATRVGIAQGSQTFHHGLPESETRAAPAAGAGQIVKRVSVDQRSERISPSSGQWEDAASHHTVSESGDSVGSVDSEGRWQSSDYDTSGLSAAEIRKLERKGINPALYMEMKDAKKGKKWAPSLLGNGFLS